MCLCCRDEALWCAGDCFEACCYKCSCSISPCCGKCFSWCKCWTCCINCCLKWCPCYCWPPRQCMAWFLGIIGFFFMLSTLLAPDWLTHEGAGPLPAYQLNDVDPIQTSWGLYEGCALTLVTDKDGQQVQEWECSPTVSMPNPNPNPNIKNPDIKKALNDLISEKFGWLASVGLLITFGEVFLFIALVIVFIGLCCPFRWRFVMFRSGMYLYLLADLLFMIGLIVYLAQLNSTEAVKTLNNTVGWCIGMGWGVVIIVFTGALLLLLDKDPPKKSDPEDLRA